MPLFILIFLLLLAITIVVIVVYSRRKKQQSLSEFCLSDDDCPKMDACIVNPENNDKKQCFPAQKFFCTAFPFTSLTKCRLDDKESCSECLNNPKFTCVQVTKDKPYTWIQDGKTVYIPESAENYGWCLPNLVNRDVICNAFTSDYVLEEVGDGMYQWGCLCKYPNLFDHANGDSTGDCILPLACGTPNNFGHLVVPTEKKCSLDSDCGGTNICRQRLTPSPCGYNNGGVQPLIDCSATGANCVCHTRWSGENIQKINPLTGRCECDNELQFQCVKRSSDYFEFNCVQGFCNSPDPNNPWSVDDPKNCNNNQCYLQGGDSSNCVCCKCPQGFLRCPDDIIANNKGLVNYCERNGPTCIPDPCKTADVPTGYYDKNKGTCVCPGDTATVWLDENSPIGATCKDLCGKDNPCANRGKCHVVNRQALCCDCVSPYTNDGDNSCTCAGQDGKKGAGEPCCKDTDCGSGVCRGAKCDSGGVQFSGVCIGQPPPNSKCTDKQCVVKKIGPVVCGGSSTCPQDTTCCQVPSGNWNCCPYPNATCCEDNIHCCPTDHPKCDVKKGMCSKDDGSDPIAWKDTKIPT